MKSEKMSTFSRLQRNNSIEKFKEKRKRRIKFTDFTSDGQLPKKAAKEFKETPKKSFVDERIDLNEYFDPVFDELKKRLSAEASDDIQKNTPDNAQGRINYFSTKLFYSLDFSEQQNNLFLPAQVDPINTNSQTDTDAAEINQASSKETALQHSHQKFSNIGGSEDEESDDEAFETYISAVMRSTEKSIGSNAAVPSNLSKSNTEDCKMSRKKSQEDSSQTKTLYRTRDKSVVDSVNSSTLDESSQKASPELINDQTESETDLNIEPSPKEVKIQQTSAERNSPSSSDSDTSNQGYCKDDITRSNLVKIPTLNNLAPDCRDFILEIFEEIFNSSLAKHEAKYCKSNLPKAEDLPAEESSGERKQAESGRKATDQNLQNRRELFASSKTPGRKAPVVKPRNRSKKTEMSKQRQELFSGTKSKDSFETISRISVSPSNEEEAKSLSNSMSGAQVKNAKPRPIKGKSIDQPLQSTKKPSFFKRLFGGSKKEKQDKNKAEVSKKTSIARKPSFSVPVKPPRPPSVRNRKPSDQEMSHYHPENNFSFVIFGVDI